MSNRTMVNFNERIAPIFRKYANTYGVKNTCSLGAILVDRLDSDQRERLMSLVAEDAPIETIETELRQIEARNFRALMELSKKGKRRIYKE